MQHSARQSILCVLSIVAASLVFVLGEGRRSHPPSATANDTLVIATTVEPTTLHPVFGNDRMATVEILGTLFEPLTLYDDQHRLIPCLATEVPTHANHGLRELPEEEAARRGGRMETIWHLRSDARWSDGMPVTADDFIFTFELVMNDQVPAVSREVETRIAKMESRDGGRTLVVLWKEPYAFAHEGHRHLVIPRHIEEPRLLALAPEEQKEYEHAAFNHRPIGNGPFQLVRWDPGRLMVLERQPYWRGPGPLLSRIIYRFLPESETVLANLDTGRIGAVSPMALDFDLGLEYDLRAKARGDSTYQTHIQPGLWWEHIDFNTENPVTADKRVRQALALGLNRRALAETLALGEQALTDTWLPPLHPAAFPAPGRLHPDLPRYPYDPQRAAQLLDEAGWHTDVDRMRRKDGRRLQLTLTYIPGEPLTDRVAQLAQADWRRLGVELNLRLLDVTKFDEASAENRAYQGLSLYPWVMDPSADGITFWTSTNIPTDENPTGQNASRWRNQQSDELLQRAAQSLDPRKRVELMRSQQRIWAEELPAIPLFFKPEISIRHRNLHGWRPTGTDTPITWNCSEWHWER